MDVTGKSKRTKPQLLKTNDLNIKNIKIKGISKNNKNKNKLEEKVKNFKEEIEKNKKRLMIHGNSSSYKKSPDISKPSTEYRKSNRKGKREPTSPYLAIHNPSSSSKLDNDEKKKTSQTNKIIPGLVINKYSCPPDLQKATTKQQIKFDNIKLKDSREEKKNITKLSDLAVKINTPVLNFHQKRVLERCLEKFQQGKNIILPTNASTSVQKGSCSKPPSISPSKKNKRHRSFKDVKRIENSKNNTQINNSHNVKSPSTPENLAEKRMAKLKRKISTSPLEEHICFTPHNIKSYKTRRAQRNVDDSKSIENNSAIEDADEDNISHSHILDSTRLQMLGECVNRNEEEGEMMEWEINQSFNEQNITKSKSSNLENYHTTESETNSVSNQITIVIDTNILISHIDTVKKLSYSVYTVEDRDPNIMIPWRVLCELDGLKLSSDMQKQSMARHALRFLHENLSSNNKMRGQSVKDANDHIFPCNLPDDEILNCCLQLAARGEKTAMLTDDINLCNKVTVNNIKSYTHKNFILNLKNSHSVNKLNSSINSLLSKDHKAYSVLSREDSVSFIPNVNHEQLSILESMYFGLEQVLVDLLSPVLKGEMVLRYDDLWIKIIFVEPPWTLSDLFKCFLKHWIAVFKEIFSLSIHSTLKELQRFYPQKIIGLHSIDNIKKRCVLSLELVNYCKNISKYKIESEKCSDYINHILSFAEDGNELEESISSTHNISLENNNKLDVLGNNCVIKAFNFIWIAFSSFCFQLANALGVSNTLQSTEPILPLQDLISNANPVSNQLRFILIYLQRVLVIKAEGDLIPHPSEIEKPLFAAFHSVLCDTLMGIGHLNVSFDEKEVFQLCLLYRNILNEGYEKFLSLYNLLRNCSQKYSTTLTVQS